MIDVVLILWTSWMRQKIDFVLSQELLCHTDRMRLCIILLVKDVWAPLETGHHMRLKKHWGYSVQRWYHFLAYDPRSGRTLVIFFDLGQWLAILCLLLLPRGLFPLHRHKRSILGLGASHGCAHLPDQCRTCSWRRTTPFSIICSSSSREPVPIDVGSSDSEGSDMAASTGGPMACNLLRSVLTLKVRLVRLHLVVFLATLSSVRKDPSGIDAHDPGQQLVPFVLPVLGRLLVALEARNRFCSL